MKKILFYLVSTFIFNTAIAGMLTMILPGGQFWINFIYSQCIGLSVMAVNGTIVHALKSLIVRWVVLSCTLPTSVALGLTLAFFLSGIGSWSEKYVWPNMLLGLFFGLIGSIILLLSRQVESELKKRRLVQSESEKREIEANLKLLQAQIEPHFLFNTLANVSSLIDSDPALAKKLLERLNDWLRVALVRARSHSATLGDELEMLDNYLQIMKIRFGDRLRWTIDVPENLRLLPFPPMLLQPLVENAVRHGIEPKIGGGEIGISSRFENSSFHIEVSDTGVGLLNEEGSGSGLANVRARLNVLFGTSGRLILQDKVGGGVCAVLELPR
jgi:sensor histidine kinase YesM